MTRPRSDDEKEVRADPPGNAIDDPLCMHCRIALTPCTCWRGRGCEHNGWMHVPSSTHECPGMPTKAYPSSQSLRDRLRADAPGVPPEAVMAFRTGMGAWYADSITDQAIGRGLAAAAPVIAAQAARDERQRIIDLAQQVYEEAGWCRECGSHALLTLRVMLRGELTPEQAAAEHTRLSEELERDESTPSAADRSRWVDGLTKRPQ